MPSFLVHGNDFLVAQEVKSIERDFGADDLLEGNKTLFDSSSFSIPNFQQVTQALPFMDVIRLVILEDVVKNNTTVGTSIIDQLDSFPDSTLLIIKEHTNKINSSLSKIDPTKLIVRNVQGPSNNRELHQWIKEHAQDRAIPISPSGITALANHVGLNLWNMTNELEKLSLYTQGSQITDAEVKELVHSTEDINLFGTIDAVIEQKRAIAFHNINTLLEDGHDTNSIIRLIGRQLRLIATAKALLNSNTSHTDLKQKLGINSNFIVDKVLSQSKQIPLTNLLYMFECLTQADIDIKSGVVEGPVAIDIFLNKIT